MTVGVITNLSANVKMTSKQASSEGWKEEINKFKKN